MRQCSHPICDKPLAFLYHDARGPLLRRECGRLFRPLIRKLVLLPESPNQVPGSDHNCCESLHFMGFLASDRLKVQCVRCGKIFQAELEKFVHAQGYTTCSN